MDITTFMILVSIYLVLIVIGSFIPEKYRIWYIIIVILGTLCFMNIYNLIYYVIELRNDPGIPGPRGPKGNKGPTGRKGSCVQSDKCGFSATDADKMLYDLAASKFETSRACLKEPSLASCTGGVAEVERIRPVSTQIKMLEAIANEGLYTRTQFKQKIENSLGSI
jgi:hypothetical protein